jgi:hypothetical protein
MFEEIVFMVFFAVASIIMSYILLKFAPNPIDKFFQALAVVGIVIHELSHALMCVLTNTHIRTIKILKRADPESKFGLKYGGRVDLKDYVKLTFLQALLIGLAPLYISFWLFFFLWEQIQNPTLDVVVFYVYLFVMISLVLSAAPSFADVVNIFGAFYFDWRYSLYQICLLLLSIGTVWLVITSYRIQVFHEIITYIAILIGYYGFKVGAMGLKSTYLHFVRKRKGNFYTRNIKSRSMTRRRVTPIKTKDEAQW